MVQVIRVCDDDDDDDGGVGRVSTRIFAQCACANKCADAWSVAADASVPGCSQHGISFFILPGGVFFFVVFARVCARGRCSWIHRSSSQGECGLVLWVVFGDSKCTVPQSLRALNYLSSSP